MEQLNLRWISVDSVKKKLFFFLPFNELFIVMQSDMSEFALNKSYYFQDRFGEASPI